MANLGEITEIVNAAELTLEVGVDKYIALTNLQLHVGRTEDRTVISDSIPLYTFGAGDNFFTATLVFTGDETDNFNTLSQIDSDGDMSSTAWKIVAKDISGTSKTFAATGILRDYDVRKVPEGKIEIDIFVRITGDTVTIT